MNRSESHLARNLVLARDGIPGRLDERARALSTCPYSCSISAASRSAMDARRPEVTAAADDAVGPPAGASAEPDVAPGARLFGAYAARVSA